MAILKTEQLTYTYSPGSPFEKTAVDHVDIEINKGEMIGVMGHTGSGKSTLIQHFNGLLRPTSGKVFLDGEDIWADKKKIRDVRFRVGLVFQYPEYQIFEETVFKDIAFGPKNMGLGEAKYICCSSKKSNKRLSSPGTKKIQRKRKYIAKTRASQGRRSF